MLSQEFPSKTILAQLDGTDVATQKRGVSGIRVRGVDHASLGAEMVC